MNLYLLGIGSNQNTNTTIPVAQKLLSEHFAHITWSSIVESQPFEAECTFPFANTLALIITETPIDELQAITKEIEQLMGRKVNDKQHGIVKIDIDIIKQNEKIIRPTEYKRPYIQKLLPEMRKLTHIPTL